MEPQVVRFINAVPAFADPDKIAGAGFRVRPRSDKTVIKLVGFSESPVRDERASGGKSQRIFHDAHRLAREQH